MAIAVSQGVIEAQSRKTKNARIEIEYRRRFWDIETQAFVLEAAATSVLLKDINGVSALREALDRKGVNRFESNNVTIDLKNITNIWNPRNPDGLFAANSIARLGFEPQLMEFSLNMIYELEDGSDSTPIPIMIGGRAIDFNMRPDDNAVSITIESKGILLKRADAENVSITRTNKGLLGVVGGGNTTFTSPDFGVGRVDEVREATVEKRLGTDVKISDLNNPDIGATFEFAVAPVVQPFADYITWIFDDVIENLVGLLADESGILAADRDIVPVTFPNSVINKEIFTSQADWESGTIVDLNTIISPGDLRLRDLDVFEDWEDGDFTDGTPRTWTPRFSPPEWAINGGILIHTFVAVVGNSLQTPSAQTTGTWEIDMALSGSDVNFDPMATTDAAATTTGYSLTVVTSGVGLSVVFGRKDAGAFTTLFSGGGNSDAAFHTYRLTRTAAGFWRIFKDGTLIGTVTDNTHTTTSFILLHTFSVSAPQWGDIKTSAANLAPGEFFSTGTFETPEIDAGVTLTAWRNLDKIDLIPIGTTLLYETAVATISGGPFDPFVAISPGDIIQSDVKRFIKVRITFTSNVANDATPIVSEIAVNFITATTTIRLANFTKLTVFQAISILARISNFEWGFSRGGRLFFRPRTFKTTPDFLVELKDLTAFSRISDGTERVFNLIRAAYGAHEKIVTPITQNDPSPNSFDKFQTKQLSVGSTQILIDPDADIATGLAIGYYNEFKDPRRIFELEIDMLPQAELADAMLLRILDDVPDPSWHIGDTSRGIGFSDIRLYGAEQQSACEILTRIFSIRNNPVTMKTSLELEEVI